MPTPPRFSLTHCAQAGSTSLPCWICDEHGLPRKGFYFERGIWASSRLLKGAACADPLSWSETELGLRSLGLKFCHSKLPRSKPIERVIGALQDLMEGEPGYVGLDEMHEKFERIAKIKLQVESKKTHPSEHFYTLDEWTARLEEICAKYDATPQDGKMTCGLSPDDAFAKFRRDDDPPIRLPASCRYLGAVPIAASPYLRGFAKGLAEIKTVDYCQKWQKRLL